LALSVKEWEVGDENSETHVFAALQKFNLFRERKGWTKSWPVIGFVGATRRYDGLSFDLRKIAELSM
jgi:hypothetical protein